MTKTNLQIAEMVSEAFEIFNEPKNITPQTAKYRLKDVDLALDKLIEVMHELGLNYG